MNVIAKDPSAARVDARGRAYAGSQRWIQEFVNRWSDRLNEAILNALPTLNDIHPVVEWVSPLEADGYAEYHDDQFLNHVGLSQNTMQLRSFWPAGGPHWDALAKIRTRQGSGVLLIEAKSYPGELYSCGCQARLRSRTQIETALARTNS